MSKESFNDRTCGDEEVGLIEAIGRSWHETAERFWTILCFFIIIYAPLLLAFACYALVTSAYLTLPSAFIFNALITGMTMAGWYGTVAIYSSTRSRPHYDEVFA